MKRRCSLIRSLVGEKVKFFFPKGHYVSVAASLIGYPSIFGYELEKRLLGKRVEDPFRKAACYVVYFPSRWSNDQLALFQKIKAALSSDGVLMVVESTEDLSGVEMCKVADKWKKMLGMQCVVDQMQYQGRLEFVKPALVFYQFWKKPVLVSSVWEEY